MIHFSWCITAFVFGALAESLVFSRKTRAEFQALKARWLVLNETLKQQINETLKQQIKDDR